MGTRTRLMCAALMAVSAGLAAQTAPPPPPPPSLDQQLRALIQAQHLTGDPSAGRRLPDISTPLAQLGMRLFFSRSLGGTYQAACASCHYPALAGADQLSLAVGTGAIDANLVGAGRGTPSGLPLVARNAPTTFNVGFYDHFLFDDGRIESLNPRPGANGSAGAIRTPDSAFGQADPNAGTSLPAAQSRFPVTVAEEMRGSFLGGASNDALRKRLAARIGHYGSGASDLPYDQWLPLFQQGFGMAGGSAQNLVTPDNIAAALAEYERSQVFVNSPWKAYVAGDNAALSDAAKRGAVLFLTPQNQNGAGCSRCHRGDNFSDEDFHVLAVPQFGPGKGDGAHGDDDFGRKRESGAANDLYAFRTPSLLNVALTAPYDHDGAFATLAAVVNHYRNPQDAATYVQQKAWCRLPQYAALGSSQCQALYPDAAANTQAALAQLQAQRGGRGFAPVRISDAQAADLVSFLQSLSDPCAANAKCTARWIPLRDGGPDHHQLSAVDQHGNPL